MHRVRIAPVWLAVVLVAASSASAEGRQGPPVEPAESTTIRFLEGLRDRGYFDLADDYLSGVLDDPDTPDSIKPKLAFEAARNPLLEASTAADLERRDLLLDRGRVALDGFLKDHPDTPLRPQARAELAQVIYQRGQTAALKAEEATAEADRDARLAEARAAFAQARAAFDAAIDDLEAAYDAFPTGFIAEDDPNRSARDEAQRQLIDAMLKRALVDYDEAQTFPEGGEERVALLEPAVEAFKSIYNNYRIWMAGFAARMWQGKSLEEMGELGAAMGIYNEILAHDEPSIRDLQRQVAFFKVIAHRKREEYPLAERLAREWLELSRGDTGSYERLGVQLELARNIDAQLEQGYPPAVANREALVSDLVGQLGQVVRYASPYKADAVELLTKYRPDAAIDPRDLARLTFDQAMERGREAMGLRSWDGAIALFRAAIGKIEPSRSPERANEARYLLAFSFYNAGRYHEAAVLADFLARRYPDWESAQAATELEMGALAQAYETVGGPGRESDLRRLEAFAAYTEATWPGAPQADVARILRGDIALGQGRYDEAASAYERVRTPSHALDAKGKAASAHWRRGLSLRKQAEGSTATPEADAEVARALALLDEALESRIESRVPPSDPGFARNVGDLAEIHLAEGRPSEALARLDPAVEAMGAAALNDATRPLFVRLLKLRLQAHIAEGRSDAAISDMKALESAASGESLTQLFFGLGRLLEDEMQAQRAAGNRAKLEASRNAFQQFLDALVGSDSGQSFESLQWAGEQMIALDRPERAIAIFDRVQQDFPDHDRLLRTRLKRSEAFRKAGKFNDAWTVTAKLIAEHPKALDFLIEQAQILEDWAEVEPGYWNVAIRHWQDLAKKLERSRPRPPEYYECWYHVALCQVGKGSPDSARKTLKSVRALSTTLGTPEIKAKYDDLLRRVGG